MKPRLKLALLASTIILALSGCNDENKNNTALNNGDTATSATSSTTPIEIKTEEQKIAYAVGASFSDLVKKMLEAQNDQFDQNYFIRGFTDDFNNKNQLSTEEVNTILVDYDNKKAQAREAFIRKVTEENIAAGTAFREQFAQQTNVKKTASGLLYKIEKEGTGKSPDAYDNVSVNYVGKLVNGDEFGNSHKDGKPLIYKLSGIIEGWSEGTMLLKEGGKVTLVIPPELGFKDIEVPNRDNFTEITPQSTLIIELELIKVDPEIVDENAEDTDITKQNNTQNTASNANSPTDKTPNPAQPATIKENKTKASDEIKPSTDKAKEKPAESPKEKTPATSSDKQ